MTLADTLTLLKAGYKKKDIDEMLKKEENQQPETKPEVKTPDKPEELPAKDAEKEANESDLPKEETKTDDIDEIKKELERLRKENAALQQANVRKDVSEQEVNVDDAVKDFYRRS